MDLKEAISTNIGLIQELRKSLSSPEFILKELEDLEELLKSYTSSEESLNNTSGLSILHLLEKYLHKSSKRSQALPKRSALKSLEVYTSKLRQIKNMIPSAFTMPADDILILDRDHERWQRLYEVIDFIEIEGIDHSFKEHCKSLFFLISFIWKSHKLKSSAWNRMLMGYYFLKYATSKKKVKKTAKYAIWVCDKKMLLNLWRSADSKMMLNAYPKMIVPIQFSERIFIDRSRTSFNLESEHYSQSFYSESLGESNTERIPIRIMSHQNIPKVKIQETHCCAGQPTPVSDKTLADTLVLHMHGGGFVAMSSFSHQGYLRQWANQLEVPVLSIDYRLAPEHPFPAAHDDVWEVYLWVLQNAERQLGITPSKIILAGDSAGGNLALGLIHRIIQEGQRVPDGLFLAYPCVNMSDSSYSPSLEHSIKDLILPKNFLDIFRHAYVNEYDQNKIQFLSPIHGDFYGFPKVRILVGDLDPLLDMTIRLTEKLMNAGVDVRTKIYKKAVHGLLSFDNKKGISDCHKVTLDSIEMIRELIHS